MADGLPVSDTELLRKKEEVVAVVQAAVGDLPSSAQQEVAANVVGNLEADQKLAVVQAAVGDLSSSAQQEVTANAVRSAKTPNQKQAVVQAAAEELSEDQRRAVGSSLLGTPDPIAQRRLWYMVIGTMALSVFVFGYMAYQLIGVDKAAEAPLALATTALGGIVAILSTSPAGRSR